MNKISLDTICTAENYNPPPQKAHSMPLYATSSFDINGLTESTELFSGGKQGYMYSRYGNPNTVALAEKLAALEGWQLEGATSALMTASGMAAITAAVMAIMTPGSTLISHTGLYGATSEVFNLLADKVGFNIAWVDFSDMSEVERILESNVVNMIYVETPSNPLLNCVDLKLVSEIGIKHGAKTVADNTFATPLIQQPLSYGIDVVVHSTTKYLAGNGQSIAGAIITRDPEQYIILEKQIRLMGSHCSPFEAWMTYHGLKTLGLRLRKQVDNATQIFKALTQMDQVTKIYFTGDPTHPQANLIKAQMRQPVPMISFELKAGLSAANHFFDKIQLIRQATTLGDINTICLHPDTSSHRNIALREKQKIGITPGLIRLSVGIEDLIDLIGDLNQAIK